MSRSLRLDRYQRRHDWLGLPIAVLYKFVDDQGGYLSALIAYYGFLSVFPLLLVAVTVLGFVISNHPHLQTEVIGSALSQFPIVGKELQTDIHGYRGSGAGLVIGIIGAIYGSLGVAQAAQNALNIVWAVPRNSRPNPLKARLRSVVTVSTLGLGVLATTGVSAFGPGSSGRIWTTLVAGLINTGLFATAYRYLSVADVSWRDVVPGAVVAGVAWALLQTIGTYYIAHKLKGASEVYGVFAIVLGLIAWIYVEALVIVICAELNVVLRRRLWPRALLTPFTDNIDMTAADASAYGSYARAQRYKGFQRIAVDFEGEHGAASDAAEGAEGAGGDAPSLPCEDGRARRGPPAEEGT